MRNFFFDVIIFRIFSLFKIREIEFFRHEILKYLITFYYFLNVDDKENEVFVYIYRKIYIVNNLRIKMLIENNIIDFEKIIINVIKKKFILIVVKY